MILFPELLDLPRRLRHPEVRDLAWAIIAPPMLIDTPWPQRHPLAGSDWVQAPDQLEHWLRQLDRDSYPLLHCLSLGRTRRLGLYYERLWQFAVQHAPGIELIAANLPIRHEGHTLGELDLLLRDRDGIHHLELAIKLYLGPQQGDGRDTAQWLGPGCHDRLDRKLAHLREHQLPISARPESREALAALGIEPTGLEVFRSELWLGGYLLYPGRATPTRRPVRIPGICGAVGCISGIGLHSSPSAHLGAGNPCPAPPGWPRRIIRRSRPGAPRNWTPGDWTLTRWRQRN